MIVFAPISVGELIDKITILDIKLKEVINPFKLANVRKEREELALIYEQLTLPTEIKYKEQELYTTNLELWHIENYKRACEHKACFDQAFIDAARNVYLKNDARATIKYEINLICGSAIIEEKYHDTGDKI